MGLFASLHSLRGAHLQEGSAVERAVHSVLSGIDFDGAAALRWVLCVLFRGTLEPVWGTLEPVRPQSKNKKRVAPETLTSAAQVESYGAENKKRRLDNKV
jgi:hypothetical protein